MQQAPGTYLLVLSSRSRQEIEIGRWGTLELIPTHYLYIGSAFGPGGVRARVLRHARTHKPKHWHIDYLREVTVLKGVYFSHLPERLEHRWAQTLSVLSDMHSVAGFGCSDCRCHSHLFESLAYPAYEQLAGVLGGQIESWHPGPEIS